MLMSYIPVRQNEYSKQKNQSLLTNFSFVPSFAETLQSLMLNVGLCVCSVPTD